MLWMYILFMSTRTNNLCDSEINVPSPIDMSYSEGPWIPQTPDSQQDPDPKEQWQDDEEE